MYGGRAILCSICFWLGASALLAGEVVGPNPEAPPETAQYAFLIGEWDCTIRSMQPDRTFEERQAKWTGHYILDGWAIQDHWVDLGPGGRRGEGTNIRSFNPQTGKWDNRWLATGSLQWKYFSSEMVGDTMVMTGGEGTDPFGDYIDRNTFYEIEVDSWRWRKDRSYDGGKTWIEGVAFIEARRAES
jgi:hypothetical protein